MKPIIAVVSVFLIVNFPFCFNYALKSAASWSSASRKANSKHGSRSTTKRTSQETTENYNASAGCSINMNGDLPSDNEPIMLSKTGKEINLLIPEVKNRNGYILLNKGQEVILICTGKGNKLKEFDKETVTSSCLSQSDLSSENKLFNTRTTQCKKPVEAVVKDIKETCVEKAKNYQIGFEAEGWRQMITVCHDTANANTLFSSHTIIGNALQGATRESDRPRFNTGGLSDLYTGYDPNDFYKTKSQQQMFASLLGEEKSSTYFNETEEKYLSRGHLAPDGDFLFASWQFSTYFYINAVPQWQAINSGNWLTVEKLIRRKASKIRRDLTVITGTQGILKLADSKGKSKEIWLNKSKSKIPVPEYMWKLIYDSKTKEAIGVITSNNPYLSKDTRLDYCGGADTCVSADWANEETREQFLNAKKGLTVCCSIKDFKQVIKNLPAIEDLNGSKILKGYPFKSSTTSKANNDGVGSD